MSTIPRRHPHVGEFFRVCPAMGHRTDYSMVYAPDEDDWYAVAPSVRSDICSLTTARVSVCENLVGERFVWCIDLARSLPSYGSPAAAELVMATAAESLWCSRQETLAGLSFSTLPRGVYPEPIWGALSYTTALESAFWDRFITSAEHPLLVAHQVAR